MGDEVGESTQSQKHLSADDLNDGFILDKEDKKTLSYQVRDNTTLCGLMFSSHWNIFTVLLIFFVFQYRIFFINLCFIC